MDKVPVDVVVNGLFIYTALATSGCIHAVRGENERVPLPSVLRIVYG